MDIPVVDGGFSIDLAILLISLSVYFIHFVLQISGMRLTGLFWITYNFRKTSILFICPYTSSWFRGEKLLFGKYLLPEGL